MKKLFTLLLIGTMLVSLSACGNQTVASNTVETESTVQTETSSESAEIEETAAISTETETVVVAETSFDTSWTTNDFEKLIPQPPVGDAEWKTEQKDDSTYRITTHGSNLNLEIFMEYVNSLSDYGFTIEEEMADYIYIATDAAGNSIKFLRESNIHQYTITKAN